MIPLAGGAGTTCFMVGPGMTRCLAAMAVTFWSGARGGDRLDGGLGLDIAGYRDASAGVKADLLTPAANLGDALKDIYVAVEGLEGSAFADTLLGDASANLLIGGAGNDRLEGRDGADTLQGNLGDDMLLGGVGADTFVFDAGHDVISDFQDGVDLIAISAGLLGGGALDVVDLLSTAVVTNSGLELDLGNGAVLDILGVLDASLLADNIVFV